MTAFLSVFKGVRLLCQHVEFVYDVNGLSRGIIDTLPQAPDFIDARLLAASISITSIALPSVIAMHITQVLRAHPCR